MSRDFYPFVEEEPPGAAGAPSDPAAPTLAPRCPARIAVYDDAAAAPRVVMVDPSDVRTFLEETTATVSRLAREQGGTIPFMVIREIVENYVHAYFASPTISILDGGNTIRFSDQGPGIAEKDRALEYGTTSATEEMKRYIRGVGSGLPYAQHYMRDKGGSLQIEDNIQGGTVVTISVRPAAEALQVAGVGGATGEPVMVAAGGPAAATTTTGPATPQTTPTAPTPAASLADGAPYPALPALSDRERAALDHLAGHANAGPTDLARALGASGPTWSRTLQALAQKGLALKDGQKYRLTAIGRALTQG